MLLHLEVRPVFPWRIIGGAPRPKPLSARAHPCFVRATSHSRVQKNFEDLVQKFWEERAACVCALPLSTAGHPAPELRKSRPQPACLAPWGAFEDRGGGATTGSTPAGRMLAQCCSPTLFRFSLTYWLRGQGIQRRSFCQHFRRSLPHPIAAIMRPQVGVNPGKVQLCRL